MLDHQAFVRLGCFSLVLGLMAAWEFLAPRRRLALSRVPRWIGNLGLVVLDTLVLRLLLPLGAVGVALLAEERQWGLFHQVDLPLWLAVVLSVLALDLATYFQHVLFHAVPVLWRLHLVHHSDLDFDVTTGVRFHPLEILLSMLFKWGFVVLLGAPALAVLLFEVLLNASSMFNHANVALPLWLDRFLRLLIVTPDMHRVHHSVDPAETNRNFGFALPWWDRLLGTYRAQPARGHEDMGIGLQTPRDVPRVTRLHWLLILPLPLPPTLGAQPEPLHPPTE